MGLGNPGEDYRDTRHNIGFMVLEEVAHRLAIAFQPEKKWNAHLARVASTWFIKPQTYMNDSGRSVAAVAKFQKITPAETLVVYDDLDLPLGGLRLRPAGSAGGHNGMKSIVNSFGTDAFPRLKVGIAPGGGRPDGGRMVGYVLGRFQEDERATLAQVIDRAADAVQHILKHGVESAMNLFNRK